MSYLLCWAWACCLAMPAASLMTTSDRGCAGSSRRGDRHPALVGYEAMLQPPSISVEARAATLDRHPATRRLFFEPDLPVELGQSQIPTTALQLQVARVQE